MAFLYFASAKLSMVFAIEPGNISPIWIPSGICFVWVLKFGFRTLPGVFVGAFAANVSAYIFPLVPAKLLPAVIAGLANGLGDSLFIYLAVYFIFKNNDQKRLLLNLSSAVGFVFVSCVLGGLVSAILGVGALNILGLLPSESFNTAFITWWIGDAMGLVILGPLLENIFVTRIYKKIHISKKEIIELILGLLITSSVVAISYYFSVKHGFKLVLFMAIPLMALSAFRFNEFFLNILYVLLATTGIGFTILQLGLFQAFPLNEALLHSQIIIFTMGSTAYFIKSALNYTDYLTKKMLKER